jgi:hypothetical protein
MIIYKVSVSWVDLGSYSFQGLEQLRRANEERV